MQNNGLALFDDLLQRAGITLTLTFVDRTNAASLAILASTIENLVEREADAFGAPFDRGGFPNVLRGIEDGEVVACILSMTDKDGIPRNVAGAVLLQTVNTRIANGKIENRRALFFEDTFADGEASKLIRERTACDDLPKGVGLGTYLVTAIIQRACGPNIGENVFGTVSDYYMAEHSSDNGPMMGIYAKLGAKTETNPDGKILVFQGLPDLVSSQKPMTVTVSYLGQESTQSVAVDKKFFTVDYADSDGSPVVVASYTKAISTFHGKEPVVRVNLASDGRPLEHKKLKRILSAVLEAGVDGIAERGWIRGQGTRSLRDVIYPALRIHALREREIVRALRDMSAETRYLGPDAHNIDAFLKAGKQMGKPHAMQPVEIRFSTIPKEFLSLCVPGNPLTALPVKRTIVIPRRQNNGTAPSTQRVLASQAQVA